MIQLTWIELMLLLLSAVVSGCVIYQFFLPPASAPTPQREDEDLIDHEARKRLRHYEEMDSVFSPQDSGMKELERLERKLDQLEQRVISKENAAVVNASASTVAVKTSAEGSEDLYEDPLPINEGEETYFMAKEELELTLYKAERQLHKLEERCLQYDQDTSADPSLHAQIQELMSAIATGKMKCSSATTRLQDDTCQAEILLREKNDLEEWMHELNSRLSESPLLQV